MAHGAATGLLAESDREQHCDVKLGVTLADEDVEFLDRYRREHRIGSRSAALARAVTLLRASQLGPAYADAWREWEESGEADAWQSTTADRLAP